MTDLLPATWLTMAFWSDVLKIIMVDLVLAGDNAVAVALACRNLPPEQRQRGILWGTAAAIVLRILLTIGIALLLNMPYIRLVGGLLLLWVGVSMLKPHQQSHQTQSASSVWTAVRIIIVADLVMSIDNVIAVAGASRGHVGLLIFGLLLSIPIMIWMSKMLINWMNRWPVIEVLGAALMGWIGGNLVAEEPALLALWGVPAPPSPFLLSFLGALLVLAIAGVDPLIPRRRNK